MKRYAKGEKNGRAKVTWEIVKRLRFEYASTSLSTYTLARQYKLAQSTVHDIVTQRTWLRPTNFSLAMHYQP